jgi:hypothetical protein
MPAIGCFIIAMLQGMAMRRVNLHKSDRVPIHLFVDECQYFLTDEVKTILTGARKFGLHMTLAQQQFGQEMDTTLMKTVAGNTAIKIVGLNDEDTLKKLEDRINIPLEDLRQIKRRHFYVHIDSSKKPAIYASVPSTLVGNTHSIQIEAWQRIKNEQMAKYYRKLAIPMNHVGDEPTITPMEEPSQSTGHAPTSHTNAPRHTKSAGTGKPAKPSSKPLPKPPEGEFV